MRARSEIKSLLSLEDLKSSKNQDGTSRDALEMMSDPHQMTRIKSSNEAMNTPCLIS